jgi:hypothetical protein
MTPSQESNPVPTHLEVRTALLESLHRRLFGPAGSFDEILEGMRPTENYIAGVLGPQNEKVDAEENDSLAVSGESEEGGVETAINAALSNSFKPAAIGFTCIIDEGTTVLVGSVSAARYNPVSSDDSPEVLPPADSPDEGSKVPVAGLPTPTYGTGSREGKKGRKNLVFQRHPVNSGDFDIDLSRSSGSLTFPQGRYRVEWRLRAAKGKAGARILTATVINEDRVKEVGHAIEVPKHLFQVQLTLRARDGAPFLPRSLAIDEDVRGAPDQMDLLYRDAPAFATGHGCAAIWPLANDGRVSWIQTESLPAFELPIVQSPELAGDVVSMAWLGSASKGEVVEKLLKLCDDYDAWIHSQELQVGTLGSWLSPAVVSGITACKETVLRMRNGVDTIDSDSAAWSSFQLMNRTIRAQFLRPLPGRSAVGEPRWRSFQLAFILESLTGVCREEPIEDPVHLLWFPTGGGKTEAYLGLSAFAICYRRISSHNRVGSGGVTVLMRYTLRLLTVQQFQRAASTICELEAQRRSGRADLGEEEISIGLWVGESSTPNRLKEAFQQLESRDSSGSSPVQLSYCPRCGSKLDPVTAYSPSVDRQSLVIRCPNQDCLFRDRLPVYVVDEEIYRRCPTLLVGTVDKFARLPWVEETGSLFGLVNCWCPEHGFSQTRLCAAGGRRCAVVPVPTLPPPALIIQDELHLISGPLGTMVGVYEGLIDFLSRRQGRVPVIIGSSATVRQAEDQCRALYGRPVAIFPPRALSPTNTFFSEEVPLTTRPGRLYVGVLPGGFTVKTTLIRIYASLLIDRAVLPPGPAKGTPEGNRLRDPYWTIVAYFNSLRELGGAQRLIEDDVPAQMLVYTQSSGGAADIEKEELTSRRKGSEIPGILNRIESPLGSPVEPPDMVLATNMISVGVDIKRLSAMVVTGQPKATAEYIQATSRVGREYPGLVITVYNWARPRDRSHMEDFLDYHATLYRQVEANSVTPYTDPALRRGLHGVVVAAVRILEPSMSANDAAGRFNKDSSTVKQLREFLTARLGDPRNPRDPARLVSERFESVVDQWAELARTHGARLRYSGRENALLVPIEAESDEPVEGMPTLNSLREVEPSVGLRFELS